LVNGNWLTGQRPAGHRTI